MGQRYRRVLAAYDGPHVGPRRRIAVLAAVAAASARGGLRRRVRAAPQARRARPRRRRPSSTAASAPAPRPSRPSGPRHAPVAILMYHVVAAAPPGARLQRTCGSRPAASRDTMHALAHAGYHATTLDAVWRAWHGHGSLPRHPVVISFDDGYQSQSTTARRKLDRARLARRPQPRGQQRRPQGRPGAQPRCAAMLRDGWEIDAHTLTHPDLTTVDAARLRREVAGSRRWLRRAFGVPGGLLRLSRRAATTRPSRRRSAPRATGARPPPSPARPRARPIPTRCRASGSRRR